MSLKNSIVFALGCFSTAFELLLIFKWHQNLPNVPWLEVPYFDLAFGVLARIVLLCVSSHVAFSFSCFGGTDKVVALALLSTIIRDYCVTGFALVSGHWLTEETISFLGVFHFACMTSVAWVYTRKNGDVFTFAVIELACAFVVLFQWIRSEVSAELENMLPLVVSIVVIGIARARRVRIRQLLVPSAWSLMLLWVLSELLR